MQRIEPINISVAVLILTAGMTLVFRNEISVLIDANNVRNGGHKTTYPSVATGNDRIKLFDTWELSVRNPKEYSNRSDFTEIELRATFISPTDKNIRFYGFYDGDGKGGQEGDIWKLRFMPDEPGRWKYVYRWSDGIPGGAGGFTVEDVTSPNNHGHVHVDSKHPRYLIHDDGTPHYWWGGKWISATNYGPNEKLGETNDEYVADDQILSYLDLLQEYKHNGVLLKIALFPLENDKITWDLKWIQRGEWLVREAGARGIYVQINMFDTWSRNKEKWFESETSGGKQVFNVWQPSDEHTKRNYLKTIIARFSSYSNVYWELGNEMEHEPNCGRCFVERANNVFLPWIRRYDPYKLPIGLSEAVWSPADVDIGFLHQTNELPRINWKRPTIMNELVRGGIERFPQAECGLWEDSSIRDSKQRFAYRRTFWRMFTYGGTGSSEATWLGITKPPNPAVIDVVTDQKRFRQFIMSLPVNINEMHSDPDFILSGPGSFSTRKKHAHVYVSYFLLKPGQSNAAGNATFTLPKGHYKLRWYNPKTRDYTKIARLKSNGLPTTVEVPDFTEDIVLVVLSNRSRTPQ